MMKASVRTIALGLALALAFSAGLFAQGVQTATLSGTVKSLDGEPLPGVTVTVTSPALLGERNTVTGINGDYVLRGLPPGEYKVSFSIEGMKTVERAATLPLGGTARSDASLEAAAAEETIVVTGEAPSALETTTIGANLEKQTVDQLPVVRTPTTIADLAAGLTDNTPVAGQVTINGALAYDNSILINGVNVQDPIFGQTNGLFIEDAIEETQVLTSGISSEYGGFTGGVINAITKSGGNQFSGTFRADLDKPEWRDETPFEKGRNFERKGDLNKTYSATLGGPIVKDRLWFFLAGRQFKRDTNVTLPFTGIGYVNSDDSPRYEVKLTGNITPNNSLQVSYLNNDRKQQNNRQLAPFDPRSLNANADFPNDGYSLTYSGVFTNSLYGELRYSEKKFQFKGLGGTSTDIKDSPFYSYGITNGISGLYNAPYFDATDPEDRNNKQYSGALSYFLATQATGSHDMKVGIERFTVTRTGGNSQSATNFVYFSDPAADADGNLLTDANGRFIPLFIPGVSLIANYIPVRGAKLDITTDSLFFNDRWNLNEHWSFNLGVRYEKVKSKASGGINTLDTTTFVPRLGGSFDLNGDGKYKFDVTYAEYAGRYNPAILGRNTPVGNPLGIYGYYVGPEGQGIDFAPGLDPNNYVTYGAAAPTQNIFFENNLHAPISREFTLSYGMQLPKGGYSKISYIDRKTKDFIDDFVTVDQGCVDVVVQGINTGCFDKTVYRNTSGPDRKYQGLQLEAKYNFTPNFSLEGNWTHQLKNDGNYEGEGGQAIGTSPFGNRVEVYDQQRFNPNGHLVNYQAEKIRLWTNYTMDMGRAGSLGLGVVFRYDSAQTFSYVVSSFNPTAQMRAANPGYQQLPPANLFFGDRGVGKFNDVYLFDLALNYSVPVWKSLSPWIKLTVTNLLNENKLVTFNTGIRAANAATDPKDASGLPVNFTKGANFGKGTGNANYAVPREYVLALGLRF
jgi:outer membrane receptor protein involved in Fe transport